MRKVLIYSVLLLGGLVASQVLPALGPGVYEPLTHVIRLLTMVGLAFIMIHVGQEFDLDKSHLRQYGWDYVVAATAATFPWIFVTLYFVFVLAPPEFWGQFALWKEALLQGRFAAPTSAGVLFSMLAAAGLGATWMFHKARILEYQRKARARARAELHRFLAPYHDDGVHFDEVVRSGDASVCIVEIAHEENADLVAVGRNMRVGLGRLVRPPVARQVARESTCDVLILEQEPPEAPPPGAVP